MISQLLRFFSRKKFMEDLIISLSKKGYVEIHSGRDKNTGVISFYAKIELFDQEHVKYWHKATDFNHTTPAKAVEALYIKVKAEAE